MKPLHHPLFIKFIAYFNENQDYFECHEVLEEYWKSIAPKDRTHPLVGYIQVAVALYHWRRDNFRGAAKLLAKGQKVLMTTFKEAPCYCDGVNFPALLDHLSNARSAVHANLPFTPFFIEVNDPVIREKVSKLARSGAVPSLTGARLIHKHMLRDRSPIREEQEKRRSSRH